MSEKLGGYSENIVSKPKTQDVDVNLIKTNLQDKLKLIAELEKTDQEELFNISLAINNGYIKSKKLESIENNISQTKEQTEKEKLLDYTKIAEFAYNDLVFSEDTTEKQIMVAGVNLDPLSFPDKNRLFAKEKPTDLNEDENYIYDYIKNNKDKIDYAKFDIKEIPQDVKTIFNINENNYLLANNDSTQIDIGNNLTATTLNSLKNDIILAKATVSLKEKKKGNNILTEIQKSYNIIDSFPKNFGKSESGFGGVILEDKITKEKVVSLRGTEITDWGDINADKQLAIKNVPIEQTKDMINFINKNLGPNEKFKVIGHSLGGALSQIATSIFKDRIIETYTFNSPGAKKLEVNYKKIPNELLQYFIKFDENKAKEETGELVTNVKGNKGPKLIANLGEDIGNKEINLKKLTKHGIIDMANYIHNLPENSEEFKIIYSNSENNNIIIKTDI